MNVQRWAQQTVAEAARRRGTDGIAHDDDGNPVRYNYGRSMRRLPGESRSAMADRQLNNAKNDLWEASHLDLVATFVADDGHSPPDEGPAMKAVGQGFGAGIGFVADVFQGVGRVLTAGARTALALYEKALG